MEAELESEGTKIAKVLNGDFPTPPPDPIPAEEDYQSRSTIDNEPREPKDGKQTELFDVDEHEKAVKEVITNRTPGAVDYALTLQIKGNGFQNTIKFGQEAVPAEQFEETILKRLKGEYFVQQIRGICGDQITEEEKPQQEELGFSNPLVAEANSDIVVNMELPDGGNAQIIASDSPPEDDDPLL